MGNGIKIFGVSLIALAVIILIVGGIVFAISASSGSGSGGDSDDQSFRYMCEVELFDTFVISPQIEGVSCINKGECFEFLPFSFFNEEGVLKMSDSDGVISSKNFATPILQNDFVVNIDGCTSDSQVTIQTFKEDGTLVDTFVQQVR